MTAGVETESEGLSRREVLRLGALLGALLVITGAVVLLTQGGGDSSAESRGIEGTIASVSESSFTLRPKDGGPDRLMTVRPEDARVVDVPHLEQHVRDQIPVRVVVREERGVTYAGEVIDLGPTE